VELASVGTYSGPAGTVLLPIVQAVQAWAADVNSRGGVNGHPVKFTVYDDGGDPSRHRAAVQDAVERRKVIAFLANIEAVAGASSREYISTKRIPVIGSESAAPYMHEDPMFFPQEPSGDHLLDAGLYSLAAIMVPAGKTKLGTVVCVEVTACGRAGSRWKDGAPKAGMTAVYSSQTSLAQPDFTAECLSARNAGAEVLIILLDPASTSRFALACSRQGYRPQYSAVSTVADRMKADSNLDGLLTSSGVFPYIQNDTPATAEYHRVLSTRAPSSELGVPSAKGWTAAKLFEKAAANLPEPPTSEGLLQGLWQINNETLGGLTSFPLTFVKDRPAAGRTCWFTLQIRGGTWVVPRSGQPACA
jgi:branched-chain amino acid transport system substrate-binding protein